MIDLHSHIIPGIDDGAQNLETALEMLRIAEGDGIKKIFATPHYYKGRFEASRDEVKKLLEEVRLAARGENLKIEILQGNEVLLDREILRLYNEGLISTLNDSRYILLEFPFEGPEDLALDLIYELRLKGLVPIIAHPERYISFIKKPERINDFIEEGCLLQLNGGSLTGSFGRDIQRTAELLLSHRAVGFLGSDAHSPNKRRPELKKSFDIIARKDREYAEMMNKNVENIINNHTIHYTGEKIKVNRSFFNIFKR